MTTNMMTMPLPVLSGWTWDWQGKKRRSLSAFYPTGDRVETAKGWKQRGVEVAIGHWSDHKVFNVSAYEITKGVEGAFNTSTYDLMDGVTVARTPVARYSDKALEAAFEQALAVFPEFAFTNEKIRGWFDSPSEIEEWTA